jgi:hypothetical protein
MGMMIIRHKVRDYGQWRPIFDGHVEMQRAAGLINPRVYHSADSNKSEIVGGTRQLASLRDAKIAPNVTPITILPVDYVQLFCGWSTL